MKTLMIALATAATVMTGAAHAASTSGSDGNVDVFNPNKQTLFGSVALDLEPTASTGLAGVSADQVFVSQEMINGREASIRYTLEGSDRNIISTSFRSSDR